MRCVQFLTTIGQTDRNVYSQDFKLGPQRGIVASISTAVTLRLTCTTAKFRKVVAVAPNEAIKRDDV